MRKVGGGLDPASHRFVIITETPIPPGGFRFKPDVEMTAAEVCAALMAHGMSEAHAVALLRDAVGSAQALFMPPGAKSPQSGS